MARPEGTGCSAAFLDAAQVAQVAHALERVGGAQGLRNRTIWQLSVALNFRVGEVLSLRVRDVWWTEAQQPYGTVAIDRTRTKTRRSREVPLGEYGRRALLRWMAARGPAKPGDWLFPSSQRPHQPVDYRQYEKQLVRVGKCLGIPRLRSHSARKTGANLLRLLGADLEQVRASLGHSTLQETKEYLGVSPEEAAAQASSKAAHLIQAECACPLPPLVNPDDLM